MINELGEDRVKSILSEFYCPLNIDVENFLRSGKAIEFAKQRIAATHLVFTSYKDSPVIVGYFTLASKVIVISKKSLSKNLQKRIRKFAQYDEHLRQYTMSAPLIAQLGKNFNNRYNRLITGDELLNIACEKVEKTQLDLGGKVVYLECEDKPKLRSFYEDNGFVVFGIRRLDPDERNLFEGDYLIQLLKYL
nr:N-acetyltransferase [Natranaerobius thermophilus]